MGLIRAIMKTKYMINRILSILLITITLSCYGCVEYPDDNWLVEVRDLNSVNEMSWDLEYDYKGRLSKYGTTPILYEDNRIVVGGITTIDSGEQYLKTEYWLENGCVYKSVSYGLMLIDFVMKEFAKEVSYHESQDTVFINSVYRNMLNDSVLRITSVQYIYDKERKLVEVMSRYLNHRGEESACHSYFEYSKNIRYDSNLNLHAYLIDRDGPDVFFYFLLDMNDKKDKKQLPDYIRHCVNQGKATYEADATYLFEQEHPIMMEIVSDHLELKSRLELNYYHN
jgi:hypothetical protein